MAKRITWVGVDDSKKELVAAVLAGSRQRDPEVQTVVNEDRALHRWIRKLIRENPRGRIRICYEAGPNGFSLKRRMEAMGAVEVEVMAPSLTPRRSKHRRVKTDRLDARRLATLYRSGELTPVAIPREQDEAARDLVRSYHRVRREVTRKQHQIQKLLVRRGRVWREGANWSEAYRKWLRAQQWDQWADESAFEELVMGLGELEERRRRLGHHLERLAEQERWKEETGVLRCFYGIDTDSAVTIATESFDATRFGHPRDMMSYVGLTPGVSQTGESEHRGGITKAGNAFSRWVLGQVARQYRNRPRVGVRLRQRRQGQPAWAVAIADRAHRRLYRRYWALVAKGKTPHVAATAVARELVGFIWEALNENATRKRSAELQGA